MEFVREGTLQKVVQVEITIVVQRLENSLFEPRYLSLRLKFRSSVW